MVPKERRLIHETSISPQCVYDTTMSKGQFTPVQHAIYWHCYSFDLRGQKTLDIHIRNALHPLILPKPCKCIETMHMLSSKFTTGTITVSFMCRWRVGYGLKKVNLPQCNMPYTGTVIPLISEVKRQHS